MRTSPVEAALGWSATAVLVGGATTVAAQAAGVGPAACALRAVLGVPCPACGLTGSIAGVVGGTPLVALRHDPLAVVLLVGLAVAAVSHVVALVASGRGDRRPRSLPYPGLLAAILVTVALARWGLLIAGVVDLVPA